VTVVIFGHFNPSFFTLLIGAAKLQYGLGTDNPRYATWPTLS